MKKYLLLIAILGTLGFSSCDEDDPAPPPHEVGEWNLKNFALINLPARFQMNEGRTFELSQLGFESYRLNLLANGTYEREISVSGRIPNEDAGTYTMEEDALILNSENSNDDEDFSLEKNKNNRLWLSQPLQTGLFEDAILDTLTQEYLNSLTEEEYQELLDNYLEQVNLDLVFAFEKEEQ